MFVWQGLSAVATAERLRKACMELLAGGLDRLLRSYGPVCYSGSYYLDLMAWPDLDVCLPLERSREYRIKFLNLGPRLATVCDVVSLRYKDNAQYREPRLPKGLYWGATVQRKGSLRWKIEIWAMPAQAIEVQQSELDRLKSKLTPEKRAAILSLKQALLTPEGTTPEYSGYHIYRAVLDQGMTRTREVKKYLRGKGISV